MLEIIASESEEETKEEQQKRGFTKRVWFWHYQPYGIFREGTFVDDFLSNTYKRNKPYV